jgi:hypothetical protein
VPRTVIFLVFCLQRFRLYLLPPMNDHPSDVPFGVLLPHFNDQVLVSFLLPQ